MSIAAAQMKPDIIKGDDPRLVLVCDHASNAVPDDMPLGVEAKHMADHIAYDIGAAALTRMIASLMGVSAVLAPASRLVIDCNRPPDHPTLIPAVSDGIEIPGNKAVSNAEKQKRIDQLYQPFHQAVQDVVDTASTKTKAPFIIGVHSFTPSMDGFDRPWDVGFLWDKDQRLAQAMIGFFERETDLTIGDNQPYSGKQLYHTMQIHGADRGLPQTTLEIRNDHLRDAANIGGWARLLADMLDECFDRPDLAEKKIF